MCLSIAVFMSILAMAESNRYGYGFTGPNRCQSGLKPCRLRVDIMSDAGAIVHHSEAYTCSCNLPRQCPQDWRDSNHAITRSLITEDNSNMTFSLMFCNEVTPRHVCERGETSLELSGYLNIPNDLESYNCRCDDGLPLQLSERRIENFRYYHKYVCDAFKPMCRRRQKCRTITPSVTDYFCKCRAGTECRSDGQWTAYTESLHGYCQPHGSN